MLTKTIISLTSGGLDSVTGLHYLKSQGHNVHAVIFNYKQRHVQEIEWAKYHCCRLGVLYTTIEVPQLKGSQLTDGSGSYVVPVRNAILLTLACNLAVTAGSDTVTIFCNKDDEAMFPDCRMAFIQTFNNMLRTAEINVEVCAPFIDKSKWWIAGLARELGVPIEQTWSCYEGGIKPCGKCPACLKREEALLHDCPA